MKLELDVCVRRPGGFSVELSCACETDALAIVGPSGSGKTSGWPTAPCTSDGWRT